MANPTAAIDKAVSRFDSQLAATVRSLEREIVLIVGRLDAANGTLANTAPNIDIALRIRDQVLALLRARGWTQAVRQLQTGFADVAKAARAATKGSGVDASLSTLDLSALNGMVDITIRDQIDPLATKAASEIETALYNAVVGSQAPEGLLQRIAQILDITKAQAVALAETQVAAFDRAVTSRQGQTAVANGELEGDEGEPLILYEGPEDSITRPFCDRMVGKVWTPSEINEAAVRLASIRGKQPTPASVYFGGFNCRHRPVIVTREDIEAGRYERGSLAELG